jgi:hypothetical protein
MTATAELPPGRVRTPLLRRLSALISLVSLVVITGFAVAALLGMAAVGFLLVLDAAVS